MWTREHDFAHDNYRSNGWHYFTAGLDGAGKVVALHDAFVKMQGGPGDMSAGGFPFNAIPGSQVKSSKLPAGIPTGYWRAPGDNGNVWATQCFVDELAHAAGREPLAFTLDLLTQATPQFGFDAARMTSVLKLATEKAGWGQQRAARRGAGIRDHADHGCICRRRCRCRRESRRRSRDQEDHCGRRCRHDHQPQRG